MSRGPRLRSLRELTAHRRRQVWCEDGRAHLEHLEPGSARQVFEARCGTELRALLGVREVAFLLRPPRVVVTFDEIWTTREELIAAVERAEEACAFPSDTGTDPAPSHPADAAPLIRFAGELGLDVASLVAGQTARLARVRPAPAELDLARFVTVVENSPELRAPIERQLGRYATDALLASASAAFQALAQSSTGPAVDLIQRALLLSEQASRRRAWRAWEPEVASAATSDTSQLADQRRPPPDTPEGELERYAHRSLASSAAAFTSSLVTTGDLGQAMAPLVDAVPKAARLGREAFATQLTREFGARGMLVMDRQALRRLDRVDTFVVDGRVLLATTRTGGIARPYRLAGAGRDLIRAAAAAGLQVVVSGRHVPDLAVVRAVPSHARLPREIESLQRQDHVVLAVTLDPGIALGGADVTIGVTRPGSPSPVGADLLVGADLDFVCVVVEACEIAREHTSQSVRIALAGTVLGAAAAVGRPGRDAAVQATRAIDAASLVAIANGVRLARGLFRQHLPLRHTPPPWHALDGAEVLRRLDTTMDGLPEAEAARRAPPPDPVPHVLRRFTEAIVQELATPLTPVLAAGAGLSLATGSMLDASLVSSVLGLNAAIGAVQRVQAGTAVTALDERHGALVRVRRPDGAQLVERGTLAPGDVIELLPGEVVPADARILECVALEVDEASLTGESVSVAKGVAPSSAAAVADRTSMIHDGTTVAAGEVTAVVVAIGTDTQAGRAGARSREAPPVTGVDRRLQDLTDLTIPLALTGSAGVLAAGLVRRQPLAEVVATAVNLAVAAVPEGLPLLASVAQRGAARRLARSGVVVSDPRAVEALGRVDVLCIDKTGTLTEARLRLTHVSDGASTVPVEHLDSSHRRVLLAARRATPIRLDGRAGHQTDGAVAEATRAVGIRREGTGGFAPLDALPFDPERGYHAVLARTHRGPVIAVKGAPEVVVDRCSTWVHGDRSDRLTARRRTAFLADAAELAHRGLRVLAVAERPVTELDGLADLHVDGLRLLGFIALSDPVRPTAATAVRQLREAGLRVVMVTGDHLGTATSVASQLELFPGEVLLGCQLDELEDEDLVRVLEDTVAFCRVTPEQKVRIVQAYQRAGHVVAMTGDGANDAPAIRLADVGIALGPRATGAARRSAELVITDDRIETIAAAIAEGRGLWASVRDAVAVLVGGNVGEIGYTLAGSVIGRHAPLDARQLLLVNLLTDALPAMAIASADPDGRSMEALLREGPESSLGSELERAILWRGVGTGVGAATAYVPARLTGTANHASTVGLVALVGAQLLQTAIVRTRQPAVLAAALGSTAALVGIVQTPGLSQLAGCRPLGPVGWSLGTAGAVIGTTVGALGPRLEERWWTPHRPTPPNDDGAATSADADAVVTAGTRP
jgi:cation-transporting P-type ATPase I